MASVLAGVAAISPFAAASAPVSCVGVVHSSESNLGDHVRDAAGEFSIYLRVAQLQRAHEAVGLVAVGDRHGMLRSGGERALRRLVASGVVVAKLAPKGEVGVAEHDLFLDGSGLSVEQLALLLARCLQQHGPPPTAADPEHRTPAETRAISSHLQPFVTAINRTRHDNVSTGRLTTAAVFASLPARVIPSH